MLNALVFTVMILIFDWRIGLIVVAATAVYLFITSAMEQKSAALAPHRQKSEAKLVEAVLEYVQGHERGEVLQPHRTGRSAPCRKPWNTIAAAI